MKQTIEFILQLHIILFSDKLSEKCESKLFISYYRLEHYFFVKLFQFKIQSTLTGVAQAVVDKIVRIHHDVNMSSSSSSTNGKRDDITLLVRNFNFPLPNALKSPTAPSVRFSPLVQCVAESNCENSCSDDKEEAEGSSTAEETSTETYDGPRTVENRNARIRPYVEFSEYYANVEKRRKDGTLPDGIQF